jgi:translation initiation factor IF-2
MMTVKEYAQDIGKSVAEVLRKCRELGITVDDEDTLLEEEAIIELDNVVGEMIDDEQIEELTNGFKEIKDSEPALHKEKVGKKIVSNVKQNKKDLKDKKKEMYKNKEKLISNTQEDNKIVYVEGMRVSELATKLGVTGAELVKKLFQIGILATVNASIDFDNASLLAMDYGRELTREEQNDISNFEEFKFNDKEEDLQERPAVVTIMGHVDHGKTTLLDTIRKTNVASGEAGGITQAISAYQIVYKGKPITFIDTPGHAAFTEMRARGASITDIVIIIVAADDGVMPQTKEAIDHAKAAGVPIMVVINKIDKPGANTEKVMTELTEYGLAPDTWGGDTIYTNISAKTGEGIETLLENILLIAEMQEYKANPSRYAMGTVIEAKLDKQVGPVVTLLIQNGTLRLGDPIVVGTAYGKVRTLRNDRGEEITEAKPSLPVEITGLNETPTSGDKFMAFESEKQAHSIGEARRAQAKLQENKTSNVVSLDDLFAKIGEGLKEINVIIKADVHGSSEAVKNSLEKLDVEGVRVNVVRSSVGAITESDIVLAKASNAVLIGFNIRPSNAIRDYAKENGVDIRLYNIIYKVVEEMEAAMKGMLDPIYEEKILGSAEIRQLFKFSKVGVIAGSYVLDGVIKRDSKARVIRDGVVIYEGEIGSIQREKDSVKEVKKGLECGITIENFNDIKVGDIIEAYEMVEVER